MIDDTRGVVPTRNLDEYVLSGGRKGANEEILDTVYAFYCRTMARLAKIAIKVLLPISKSCIQLQDISKGVVIEFFVSSFHLPETHKVLHL